MNHTIERIDDCLQMPLDDNSVDLVVCSPPYDKDQRAYEGRVEPFRHTSDWACWCAARFMECLRVCRGPVCWVVSGHTVKHQYSNAAEHLQIMLSDLGFCVRRPMIYYRIGQMNGGGSSGCPRNVYETIVWATKERKAPAWHDLKAAGSDAKIQAVGGPVSNRTKSDKRIENGKRVQPRRAIMKDVIDCGVVGGGNMGHQLATENEAPFKLTLAEKLILAYCPPDGTVLDPFCGSGTTSHAAEIHGRNSIGYDIRQSQVDLARRRIQDVIAKRDAS